jgi:hypothetical protein
MRIIIEIDGRDISTGSESAQTVQVDSAHPTSPQVLAKAAVARTIDAGPAPSVAMLSDPGFASTQTMSSTDTAAGEAPDMVVSNQGQ